MNPTISRVGFLAKPARGHNEFREWERAKLLVLVQASDRDDALLKARQVAKRERWEVLGLELCDRLIMERVREQGGGLYEMCNKATAEGSAFRVFPQNFAAGRNGIPPIRAPRVGESFIDQVVADVGGVRLPTDDKNRIVDYRIGPWVFELKDLQEEGLFHPERQKKLAGLFEPYAVPGQPLFLDPSILTPEEQRRFYDILCTPIKTQVKSASKQIRSTKELLGDNTLRGGIIFLNTGFGSFPDEHFGPLVERHVRKDTTQIEAIFAVSTWAVTNGFDTNVFFRSFPEGETEIDVVNRLKAAFSKRFEEAMTKLVTGQLDPKSNLAEPQIAVAFQMDGLDFAWAPPVVPLPWSEH